ncbi:hypothetical protein [Planomicrobium okeanokoites]|uniref:hypothetical protein n=1 Tax=Planomicrobium okeanokoites TaxID=244 RepID=UPI0009FE7C85|nr:hypothetical protein [Planomicrobium okeanokoites]
MVSQAWHSPRGEAQLSNQEIEGIIQMWSDYLINEKKDAPHKKFELILGRLLQLIDDSGVVYGTIKDLEGSLRVTNYILAKNFNYLAKHGLLFRRNGILVVNTEAFEEKKLKKVTKDYFK